MTAISLIHFNGANASTTFIDEVGANSITVHGAPQISTAQSVFGGSSGLFTNTYDSYLAVAMPTETTIDGNFSLSFRVYLNGTNTVRLIIIGSFKVRILNTGFIYAEYYDSLNNYYSTSQSQIALSTGQFYAVRIESYNGNFRLYVNGTQQGTEIAGQIYTSFTEIDIGGQPATDWTLNGYIDEFLLLNNESLVLGASSYTVETSEFTAGSPSSHNVPASPLSVTPEVVEANVSQRHHITANSLTVTPQNNQASVAQRHIINALPIGMTPSMPAATVGKTQAVGASVLNCSGQMLQAQVSQIHVVGATPLGMTPTMPVAELKFAHSIKASPIGMTPTMTQAAVSQIHSIGASHLFMSPEMIVRNEVFLAYTYSPENKAITTYSGFNFTNSCVFNGKTLLANDKGLFEYGGYLDDDKAITASLKTAKMNIVQGNGGTYPSTRIKRIPDGKVRIDCSKASGTLTLNITPDDKNTLTYSNRVNHTSFATHRVEIPRGIKFNYIQLEVIGTNCTFIDIDSIEYNPIETVRSER